MFVRIAVFLRLHLFMVQVTFEVTTVLTALTLFTTETDSTWPIFTQLMHLHPRLLVLPDLLTY